MKTRHLAWLAPLSACSLTLAAEARAACSGGGTSWTCPANASTSDVQTAVDGASDGATITFASGAYTWSSQIHLSTSKGVTLMCETTGTCKVAASGTVIGVTTFSGANTKLYRVSGFDFDGAHGYVVWFGSGCNGCTGTFSQIRLDHNSLTNPAESTVMFFFGEVKTIASFYGVIDHNTITAPKSVALVQMIGSVNDTPPPSPIGTPNNMFVEDNVIDITTMTNAGLGCMDGWGLNDIVWRHNKSTNCLVTTHGTTHSGGPQNIELYDNDIEVNAGSSSQGFADCYRCFHHQGSGEFIAFDNSFTAYQGKATEVMSMLHYRDYPNAIDGNAKQCDGTQSIDGNRSPTTTNRGYPCWRQPGRDFAGNLVPMYVWNNYWSDTKAQVPLDAIDYGGSPDYKPEHMKADREWYNSVSASPQTSATAPFDGTTGMGFGTLAHRPTTCTTNTSEQGGGVGYFATDVGCQGTLYRCSAANVWTEQYTPYAYPHPLVGGATDGGCGGVIADAGAPEGGATSDGGPSSDGSAPGDASEEGDGESGGGGCGCTTAPSPNSPIATGLAALIFLARRRRR